MFKSTSGGSLNVLNVLTGAGIEILKAADDIINIDDPDDRREAWGEFLEEVGVAPEILM